MFNKLTAKATSNGTVAKTVKTVKRHNHKKSAPKDFTNTLATTSFNTDFHSADGEWKGSIGFKRDDRTYKGATSSFYSVELDTAEAHIELKLTKREMEEIMTNLSFVI